MNLKAPSFVERRIDEEVGTLVERQDVLRRHIAENPDVIREFGALQAAVEFRVLQQAAPGDDQQVRQPAARLQAPKCLDQASEVLARVDIVQRENVVLPDAVPSADLRYPGRGQTLGEFGAHAVRHHDNFLRGDMQDAHDLAPGEFRRGDNPIGPLNRAARGQRPRYCDMGRQPARVRQPEHVGNHQDRLAAHVGRQRGIREEDIDRVSLQLDRIGDQVAQE